MQCVCERERQGEKEEGRLSDRMSSGSGVCTVVLISPSSGDPTQQN